jgi:hypothetical protein
MTANSYEGTPETMVEIAMTFTAVETEGCKTTAPVGRLTARTCAVTS